MIVRAGIEVKEERYTPPRKDTMVKEVARHKSTASTNFFLIDDFSS